MKNRKCLKKIFATVCTICMLLSPMSVMADEIIPLEAEETIETEEMAETSEDDSETEVTTETADDESDDSDAESEVHDEEDGLIVEEAAIFYNSDGSSGDKIDISGYADGITIDGTNWQDFDYKTITGTSSPDYNLIISGGVTLHLTIENLVIDRWDGNYGNGRYDAIEIKDNSTLILTIKGENVLKGNNESGGAGIRVEEGNKLIITADSTGKLTAIGGNGRGSAAGIGAGKCNFSGQGGSYDIISPSLGTIEIQGGTIEAQGGNSYSGIDVAMASAGIGLSAMGVPGSGSITISGGKVTATGGKNCGAGIGGGSDSYVGSITISGGEVTANVTSTKNTQSGAAAIGSGYVEGNEKRSCGDISITGGKVTVNGNIGYGSSYNSDGFEGGSVRIAEGATVTVTSGEINHPGAEVAPGTITQKYTIKVTVKNPVYTEGTVAGHINIGEGSKTFSQDITFTLEDGKAVVTFDMETTLLGEQTVKVTIDGTPLEDKTIKLGIENEIIFGGERGFSFVSLSGVTTHYENGVLSIAGSGSATISMASGVESTADRIVVENGSDVKLTLDNLSIDTTEKNKGAITIGQTGGTAKCELIPVGESTLLREDGLAGGVIEVGDQSSLTISGSGKLIIKCKGTKSTGEPRIYSAGIYAVNGVVVIEDNPYIDISAINIPDQFTHMVCIYSKNITINGGHINAVASNSGHGIGYPYVKAWDEEKVDVTITAGTIYAEGGYSKYSNGGISGMHTRVKISGGNVNMNKLKDCLPEEMEHPVNKDKEVFCTTITVGKEDDNGKNSLSKNAKVEALTIKLSDKETDYSYGTDGMYTDNEGKLYLWLPEGSVVSEVVIENAKYSGECITNNLCTTFKNGDVSCKGNSFGTAEATFTLAEGSEFHRFTKEVKSEAALKSAGTCTKKAVYFYTCEDCGAISTDKTFEGDINPDNHVNTEIRNAKEADHKTRTDGYSGDKYCKDCGKKLEQGTAIKAAPANPAPANPAPANPAPANSTPAVPVYAVPALRVSTPVITAVKEKNQSPGTGKDVIDEQRSSEDAKQSPVDSKQNTDLSPEQNKTQGSIESDENTTEISAANKDDAHKNSSARSFAVVASAITASGAVGVGVFFLLKKRLFIK